MKMENLNKTQIVLLTLLTSFVTSIATGIVTVTLMDQAPPGVTQTINRVVERTVETVVPGENRVTTVVKEVIVKEEDLIANAVEKSSKSLARISALNPEGKEVYLGMGVVLSGDGYIATDKSRITGNRNNLVVAYSDVSYPVEVVSSDTDEVVILRALPLKDPEEEDNTLKISFTPASLADSGGVKLGQSVVVLGGEAGDVVSVGIVSQLQTEQVATTGTDVESVGEEKRLRYILTSVVMGKNNIGTPLIDMDGNMIAINIATQDGSVKSLPVNDVKELLFAVTNPTAEEKIKKVGLTVRE